MALPAKADGLIKKFKFKKGGKNNMACLNPKYATYEYYYDRDQLKKRIKFIQQPIPLIEKEFKQRYPERVPEILREEIITIPCGKCANCRTQLSSDWATRCYLESQNHAQNCFITLTYNDDHYTDKNLNKRDLQLFFKRLRKKIQPVKIKIYACGEYGTTSLRKHYHAAIFGYQPEDLKKYKKNEIGQWLYTSATLEKLWGKGFVIIGQLTYESACYIARYVQKKAYGAKEMHEKLGLAPEFTTSSKRPAIAKEFWEKPDLWNKLIQNDGILIPTKAGVKLKKIPQYLLKKWKDAFPESYFQYKDNKSLENKNKMKKIAEKTDKTIYDYQDMLAEKKDKALQRLDKARTNV